MRKIIVEVPNRCSAECPVSYRANNALICKCIYRKGTFNAYSSLTPTKACREAEVK